jgi:signal transduction histidine kinase
VPVQFGHCSSRCRLLYTDEDYLKTIMQNLTSNAIKALEKTDNPKIIWEASCNNNNLMISIEDNGGKMSENQIEKLNNNSNDLGGKNGFGLQLINDLSRKINARIVTKVIQNYSTKITLIFENR